MLVIGSKLGTSTPDSLLTAGRQTMHEHDREKRRLKKAMSRGLGPASSTVTPRIIITLISAVVIRMGIVGRVASRITPASLH